MFISKGSDESDSDSDSNSRSDSDDQETDSSDAPYSFRKHKKTPKEHVEEFDKKIKEALGVSWLIS